MSEVSLKDRVLLFHLMQLPGQPQMMHMGTSYLVNDLAAEVTAVQSRHDSMSIRLDRALAEVARLKAVLDRLAVPEDARAALSDPSGEKT